MSTLDLSNVARLQRESAVCSIEHRLLLKECGCIDRGNKTELEALDRSVHACVWSVLAAVVVAAAAAALVVVAAAAAAGDGE